MFSQTVVCVDSVALNRRVEYWGPDPDSFRPERHLQEAPGVAALDDRSRGGIPLLRFGLGPRKCLGNKLADAMLLAAAAAVLLNVRLKLDDPPTAPPAAASTDRVVPFLSNCPPAFVRVMPI